MNPDAPTMRPYGRHLLMFASSYACLYPSREPFGAAHIVTVASIAGLMLAQVLQFHYPCNALVIRCPSPGTLHTRSVVACASSIV
jgi:hypothetical protein